MATVQTLSAETFAFLLMDDDVIDHGTYYDGYRYASRKGINGREYYKTFVGLCWDQIPVSFTSLARPAANVDYAEVTVPAGKKHVLMLLRGSLVTDATVANRRVNLTIKGDGTNITYQTTTGINHTASATQGYSFVAANGVATGELSNIVEICHPMGFIEIPAGGKWQLTIKAIQVGDRWAGALYVSYKEQSV